MSCPNNDDDEEEEASMGPNESGGRAVLGELRYGLGLLARLRSANEHPPPSLLDDPSLPRTRTGDRARDERDDDVPRPASSTPGMSKREANGTSCPLLVDPSESELSLVGEAVMIKLGRCGERGRWSLPGFPCPRPGLGGTTSSVDDLVGGRVLSWSFGGG